MLDHSESYKTKLAEIGNNRVKPYKYNRSKYVCQTTNIKKDNITDLGGGNYMVCGTYKGTTEYFRLNMFTSFCDCKKGRNSGPCSHKSAVAQHFGVSGFSVIPETDPKMRALWHFIGFGTVLPNHMYRGLNDKNGSHLDVQSFIEEKITNVNNDIEEENMVNDLPLTPEEKSESEEEEVSEKAFLIDNDKIAQFQMAWKCYGEKIVEQMKLSRHSKKLNKAVLSVTKMMIQSKKSRLATLENDLIWFGKEQNCTVEKGRIKAKMNVQPGSIARSRAKRTKRRGKKSTLKGRPPNNNQKKRKLIVDGQEEIINAQPKIKKRKVRRERCFKDSLAKNKPPSKRHDKQ